MSDANTCGVSQIFGAHQRFTAKTGEHQAHQLGAGCLDGETRRERGGGIEIIYAAGFAIGLKQFLNRLAVRRVHRRNMRPLPAQRKRKCGIGEAVETADAHLSFESPAFKAGEASEEWTSAVSTAYDQIRMSVHSYSRCWVHLIWGTLNREKLLNKAAAARVSGYLTEYAEKDRIYMKINFVNADHVHALIDLPTALTIEKVVQLLKGSSSHWINSKNLVTGQFAWGRGYGAFSVSESNVSRVARYIPDQEEHHRVRTFAEELKEFIERHGVRWKDEGSRQNGFCAWFPRITGLRLVLMRNIPLDGGVIGE